MISSSFRHSSTVDLLPDPNAFAVPSGVILSPQAKNLGAHRRIISMSRDASLRSA
jgi:hypothetical protein